MERGSGFGSPVMVALAVLVFSMVVMVPEVSATRWTVGSNMGWTTNFNYTVWAQGKHFYNGDWLFFVFDKHSYNVLEVNKTNYENCNDQGFIKNITRGGRDVVQLTEARPYYFLSSGGYCWNGMKVAINVEDFAPTPAPASSTENGSPSNMVSRQMIILIAFCVALACSTSKMEGFGWIFVTLNLRINRVSKQCPFSVLLALALYSLHPQQVKTFEIVDKAGHLLV
ncbi:hypothetical protein D5086_030675 [Populus alba]|uniref:Uncharacterized protein n=1 Tax=Populus alba TaxID=43335 RepID=A0ACC4APU4_POPAL